MITQYARWLELVFVSLLFLIVLSAGIRPQLRQISPCPPRPAPVPLSMPMPAAITEAFKQVESFIEQLMSELWLPGSTSAIAVYKGQVVWQYGTGQVSSDNPVPPTADTVFGLGSVSKLFPALLLYQAVDHGLIASLDDPVSKYVPAFSFVDPFKASSNITWRQVASHMAGLPREAPFNVLAMPSTDEVLTLLASQRLILPQWYSVAYSSLGFSLLGHLVGEKLLNSSSWFDALRDHILTPLNMTRTFGTFDSGFQNLTSQPYFPDGTPRTPVTWGWSSPAGGMYASANDLAKLLNALLQANDPTGDSFVMRASLAREMMLPVWVNPDQTVYWGTPWETTYSNGFFVRQKSGVSDSYASIVGLVPELELGLAFLWSYPLAGSASDSISSAAWNALLPAFVDTLAPLQPPPLAPPDTSIYLGNYSFLTSTSSVFISPSGGLLLESDFLALGAPIVVTLAWIVDDVFQIVWSSSNGSSLMWSSCTMLEELSLANEYLYFQVTSGIASSWSIPCFLGTDILFQRVPVINN